LQCHCQLYAGIYLVKTGSITKINRKDFHINYNEKIDIGPAVGDEVTIMVRTEGIKTGDVSQ
jgi:polyisoprenoid-binding protein YceI